MADQLTCGCSASARLATLMSTQRGKGSKGGGTSEKGEKAFNSFGYVQGLATTSMFARTFNLGRSKLVTT